MAYCSYCAAVLDPGQPVCARCGRPAAVAAATPSAPAVAEKRPSSVRLATILLLIAWGANFLSLAGFLVNPSVFTRMSVLVPLRMVGLSLLWMVLPICIWARQNWARFAVVVFLVWAIGNLAFTIYRYAGSSTIALTLAMPLLTDALRVWAAVLLFKPESTAWFKK
jgi:hypothetical protein